MIGRFSILKSLDLEKINKNINIYEYETGNEPYLFMNQETGNAVYEQVTKNLHGSGIRDKVILDSFDNRLGLYEGYMVFINNNLEFGEVEIR